MTVGCVQQAPDERLAFAENQLDDLRRLDHADQPGQDAEHAALRAGRNEARRRRFRVEAAVARTLFGRKDTRLAFKAKNRTVGVRLAGEHAGVIDQVARLEVVRAVGDDVVVAKDIERVRAGQHHVVLDDLCAGVERGQFVGGGVDLQSADIGRRVNDLPLQIAFVDNVEVDQPERADTGRGQIERERRTQPSRANAEHSCGLELLLTLDPDFRKDQVARIAGIVAGGKFREFYFCKGGHYLFLLGRNLICC